MKRHLPFVLFGCLFVLFSASSLPAQSAAAPQMSITLGHSAVALDGPWRFHVGDNPQWSNPDFDDSAWETTNVGITAADSYDPNGGIAAFVPGWTAKGHPGYSGFAWYRARVHLDGATGSLALLAPSNVDDSYQLFVNGRLLGSFGDFNQQPPSIYIARPRVFTIPASILRPTGTLDIAFRFYMAPHELEFIDAGGMHGPPYIGFTEAINPVYHLKMEQSFQIVVPALVTSLICFVYALLIFMLFAFDRSERILLLPFAVCVLSGLYLLLFPVTVMTLLLTATAETYALAFIGPVYLGFSALTWWAYFGLQSKKWIRNFIIVIAAFDTVDVFLFTWITTNRLSVPHSVFTMEIVLGYLESAASVILIVIIIWLGIRKAPKIDWMLLLAAIFSGIPYLYPVLQALRLRGAWVLFGSNVEIGYFTSLASLFCLAFVLVRRFRASQRRQQATLEDVKQAQEVQQVLIPEELPRVPGLAIESEYRPAREVGGDFFQIIPHPSDGSALIVAGDVAGKGLKAGMLVAVLVGAIRSTLELNSDPAFLLQALNRRLMGRGDAHATALAMRIAADGSVTLANAGHLPPYLNGKPVAVEGALPLGFIPHFEPSITRFRLNEDDQLILVSDGIAEAMDAQGHLFGFDRIEQMLAQHGKTSPADLASAAQSFGQEDDISVIAITREAQLTPAMA